jgi:hypothetical protein
MDKDLTLEKLKSMEPKTIFASGLDHDSPGGVNMTGSGKAVRWVAVRGGIHDWCIYVHWSDRTIEEIRRAGDKVCDKETIRRLVPCTDEAFAMYRY